MSDLERERQAVEAASAGPGSAAGGSQADADLPGRPAFYALRSGGWRDYVTLLHPPYTLWHLSYAAMGAAGRSARPGSTGWCRS